MVGYQIIRNFRLVVSVQGLCRKANALLVSGGPQGAPLRIGAIFLNISNISHYAARTTA